MAIITSRYPENPGKAASICAAMGSVGGVLVPWVQGYFMDIHSPFTSAVFVAVLMIIMLFIVVVLIRMLKKQQVTLLL
jgi:fucose permease